MLKGDDAWVTRKTIMRWVIDTLNMTVELPSYRIEHLFKHVDTVKLGKKYQCQ
jgi:hypothetical protein